LKSLIESLIITSLLSRGESEQPEVSEIGTGSKVGTRKSEEKSAGNRNSDPPLVLSNSKGGEEKVPYIELSVK